MTTAAQAYRELAESRSATMRWRSEMERALALGECFITTDGWCATHSTAAGPIYCARITTDTAAS